MRKYVALMLVIVFIGVLAAGRIGVSQETEEELDLAEANVTDVEYSRSGTEGEYRFSVTLYHDDSGEPGYANWWQVETLDGKQLGRRDLLHAHGTREFTRSKIIQVPEENRYVVIRGHDETHGYGGRAAIVDLNSDKTEFTDQGSESEDLSGYVQAEGVKMTSYSNEEFGFKVSYPKSWKKVFPKEEESGEPKDHREVFFLASSGGDPGEVISISVVVNEVNQTVTIDEFEQYVKLSNKLFPPGFENIYRGELAGLPAVVGESTQVDYVSKNEAKNGTEQTWEKITRKVKMIGLIHKRELYRVSVKANLNDFEEADNQYFERMLDSFELNSAG